MGTISKLQVAQQAAADCHNELGDIQGRMAQLLAALRSSREVLTGYQEQHDEVSGNWECGCELCQEAERICQ